MGKSFSKEKNYSDSISKQNNFKRRKNEMIEDSKSDEFSDFKIHGYKRKKK